jgi:signal transduction histidine kinase
MIEIRSIKAKFQVYLMLVVLIIIVFANLLTQNITHTFVDRLIYNDLLQWGRDVEAMMEPNFVYFNYSRLAFLANDILNERPGDFITLLDQRKSEIINIGGNFDQDRFFLTDRLELKRTELGGEDYYALTVPIQTQHSENVWGYIIYGRSMKEKNSMVASIRNYFFLLSMLLFIAASLALQWIIKKITRPIGTIKKGLEMVTQGNMAFRIQIETNDEFAFLANRFNGMSQRLETIMAELNAHQLELEKIANERSRALNITNEKLKKTMEELTYTQKLIIQAETQNSLTSIVSGFAHEINNPLTGILGYVDLMELNNELPPRAKKRLDNIKDQAIRIKDIISDLNQLDPEIEQTKMDIDLSTLLVKLIRIIGKLEENKGISIELENTSEPVIVHGNHFSLWQVFEGIIENSIEAIGERKVTNGKIQVKLNTSEEPGHVIVEITDNGGGFENIDRAFNPFYTTKNRTRKRGIGLSIAFNLIREHKGLISIHNSGAGAVVKITLPLYRKESAAPVAGEPALSGSEITRDGKLKKNNIVDLS